MRETNLLERFKPLIHGIVRAAFRSSAVIDADDLMQEAFLAAAKAAKQHDASCGASFRSYITTAIRRAVHKEASHFRGPFTLSQGVLSAAAKVNRLYLSGIQPTDIACRLEIDIVEVTDLLNLYRGEQVSLNHVEERVFVY